MKPLQTNGVKTPNANANVSLLDYVQLSYGSRPEYFSLFWLEYRSLKHNPVDDVLILRSLLLMRAGECVSFLK